MPPAFPFGLALCTENSSQSPPRQHGHCPAQLGAKQAQTVMHAFMVRASESLPKLSLTQARTRASGEEQLRRFRQVRYTGSESCEPRSPPEPHPTGSTGEHRDTLFSPAPGQCRQATPGPPQANTARVWTPPARGQALPTGTNCLSLDFRRQDEVCLCVTTTKSQKPSKKSHEGVQPRGKHRSFLASEYTDMPHHASFYGL